MQLPAVAAEAGATLLFLHRFFWACLRISNPLLFACFLAAPAICQEQSGRALPRALLRGPPEASGLNPGDFCRNSDPLVHQHLSGELKQHQDLRISKRATPPAGASLAARGTTMQHGSAGPALPAKRKAPPDEQQNQVLQHQALQQQGVQQQQPQQQASVSVGPLETHHLYKQLFLLQQHPLRKPSLMQRTDLQVVQGLLEVLWCWIRSRWRDAPYSQGCECLLVVVAGWQPLLSPRTAAAAQSSSKKQGKFLVQPRTARLSLTLYIDVVTDDCNAFSSSPIPFGPWRFSTATAAAVLPHSSLLQRAGVGGLPSEGCTSGDSTLLCCPHASCALALYCASPAADAAASRALQSLTAPPRGWKKAAFEDASRGGDSDPAWLLFKGLCGSVAEALPEGHDLGESCALLFEVLTAGGLASPPCPPDPLEAATATAGVQEAAVSALETVGDLLPALGPVEATRLLCCVRRLVAADEQRFPSLLLLQQQQTQPHDFQRLQQLQRHCEDHKGQPQQLRSPCLEEAFSSEGCLSLGSSRHGAFSSAEEAAAFFAKRGVVVAAGAVPLAALLLEAPTADAGGPLKPPHKAAECAAAELAQSIGRLLPQGGEASTGSTAAAPRITLPGSGTLQLQEKEEAEGLPWLHRVCWEVVGGVTAQEELKKQPQHPYNSSEYSDINDPLAPLCRSAAELMAAVLGALAATDEGTEAAVSTNPEAATSANAGAVDTLLQLLGQDRVSDVHRIVSRAPCLIDAAARLQTTAEQPQQQHGVSPQRKGPTLVGASVKFMPLHKGRRSAAVSGQQGAPKSLLGALADAGYTKAPTPYKSVHIVDDSASLLSPRRALRGCLPEGSQVKDSPVAYEVLIPPPKPALVDEASLVPISALPSWAQTAFGGIQTLNPRQSRVYPVAFLSSASFLVCAPTGAGKTNIALLALLQQLNEHRHLSDGRASRRSRGNSGSPPPPDPNTTGSTHNPTPANTPSSPTHADAPCTAPAELEEWSPPSAKHFKAVYIAPLKSLAAEVTAKFQAALAPLRIRVAEATADMPVTRKEIEQVHVFVAVPEKLDILTRNVFSISGEGECSLLDTIKCLILDEVHLLNERRGPVLEALVARLLRHSERSQRLTRLVGISATLPNWREVADFLLVSPSHAFYFGAETRPVPLMQTYMGIKEMDSNKQMRVLDECTFTAALSVVQRGHQVMVFVHSRQGTVATAEALATLAASRGHAALFALANPNAQQKALLLQLERSSRYNEFKVLAPRGFAVHHAGMLRSDRTLSERLFASGAVRVLCCTSTLAWGVNLPARCVIIKGTTVYSPQEGSGNKDIGPLDVAQVFGRAGRPQFDTVGEAVLITEYNKIAKYIRLMTSSLPVESRLLEDLPNALNAEVALGTVSSVSDAAEWLRYTFLFVRMRSHPEAYGVRRSALEDDPTLQNHRMALVEAAASRLNDCRLLRFHRRAGRLDITDLGRMAARFYVDYETAQMFARELDRGHLTDGDLLRILGSAKDFEGIRVRKEEEKELASLRGSRACRIPWRGDLDSVPCKVATLLQACLSNASLQASSLITDANYVYANAGRLARALLTASLADTVGRTDEAEKVLEWTKAIERAVAKVERLRFTQERLFSLSLPELQSICSSKADGEDLYRALRRVPMVEAEVLVSSITHNIIRVSLAVSFVEDFLWNSALHGAGELYHVWLSESDTGVLLHQEVLHLTKAHVKEKQKLTFALPLHDPTTQTQFAISIISDRWIGVSCTCPFAASQFSASGFSAAAATPLLDMHPVPVTALQNARYESLYNFSFFNPIQSQVFHVCYHTDYNVLLGAPTGSGKTIVAELTILRALRCYPGQKVVYIAPLKALAAERLQDWRQRLGKVLGLRVVQMTADTDEEEEVNPRLADLFVCTPEKWDGLSRQWRTRDFVAAVGLLIIDEIHLLGQERGPVLEAIVSRMRFISSQASRRVRLVGLSTALANAGDVAAWIGIGRVGLFSFRPAVRPVPCTVHIAGFAQKAFCPRMAAMNKPTFDAILTHALADSRSASLSTERQGIYSTHMHEGGTLFLWLQSEQQKTEYAKAISRVKASLPSFPCRQTDRQPNSKPLPPYSLALLQDATLRSVLLHGVAIHHAGLSPADREIAAHLFSLGCVRVLVATATLAWGLNLPARLVVIKGTEYFDGKTKRYTDMPVTDILQMIGRAGRPQFDTEAVAVVFCEESKKSFLKRFLYLPFPVESCLHLCLPEHLNAEIVAGTIRNKTMAIDYLTWTYFFRRLASNPGYYSSELLTEDTRGGSVAAAERRRQMIAKYLDRLVSSSLDTLLELGCISLRLPEPWEQAGDAACASADADTTAEKEKDKQGTGFRQILLSQQQEQHEMLEPIIEATPLGRIACFYYIAPKTSKMLQDKMQPEAPYLSFVDILRLLTDAEEFSQMPLRHNEEIHNAELARECPLPVRGDSFDSPHTKTFLLLQACMFKRPMPVSDYITDLKSALENSMRVIQTRRVFPRRPAGAAMIDVAAEEAQLQYALRTILLLQCLRSATHPARSSLYVLPHMTDAVVAALRQQGIVSLAHLLEDRSAAASLTRSGLTLHEKNEVLSFLARIPRLRMRWFLYAATTATEGSGAGGEEADEEELVFTQVEQQVIRRDDGQPVKCFIIPAGTDLQLEVHVRALGPLGGASNDTAAKRDNLPSSSWFVILGDVDDAADELVALRRLRIRPYGHSKLILEFSAPEEAGEVFSLSLFLCNDTYVGVDQEATLTFKTQ
ncbi:u5 small nuclear ribonucleoprotein helicase isoform 1 [Cyclospora cayetanensis]|uniref:U5 small nuclear ribonucleoprotein helicase isoform 1 n=1 Tax=Cyclospora cayetanensis TaxID=88456 RepID=A0A1D3CXC9_9EIME|nr:u5 small nuclear ribonucleoprotein helicase isoform 1 [Cyclospora cayetanensis]